MCRGPWASYAENGGSQLWCGNRARSKGASGERFVEARARAGRNRRRRAPAPMQSHLHLQSKAHLRPATSQKTSRVDGCLGEAPPSRSQSIVVVVACCCTFAAPVSWPALSPPPASPRTARNVCASEPPSASSSIQPSRRPALHGLDPFAERSEAHRSKRWLIIRSIHGSL